MSSESTQVAFTVDASVKEQAKQKLDHGELSEILRETLEEAAFGARTTEKQRIKDSLKDLREQKRRKQREKRDLEQDIDEIERKAERMEERLDQLQEQDGEFDGALELLESTLAEGSRVFVGHGQIKQAAELGQCSEEDVIETLKDRNPELPDAAFRKPRYDEPTNWDNTVRGVTGEI